MKSGTGDEWTFGHGRSLKTDTKIDDTVKAVPRMRRLSRCTYPFWVFAPKFILYITRRVPNKAVEKKRFQRKPYTG